MDTHYKNLFASFAAGSASGEEGGAFGLGFEHSHCAEPVSGGDSDGTQQRIKELNCLYMVARIIETHDGSWEHLCRHLVAVIPAGFRFPEATGVRVEVAGREFKTGDIRQTPYCITNDFAIRGVAGTVEIYRVMLASTADADFSVEERDLARAIAGQLANALGRSWAEARLLGQPSYREDDHRAPAFGSLAGQKGREAKTRFDDFHDMLTGLPNRASFINRVGHALVRLRHNNESYAVLVIDLDNFKIVNDSLGHPVGDQLLMQCAHRIRRSLRPEDTLARLGGDEFAVLVEATEDPGNPLHVAHRIQGSLKEAFHLQGYEIYTGASVGVVLGNSAYARAEDILRDADTALNRAKQCGKDCYRVFNDPMRQEAVSRLRLETELRRALNAGELAVHYQPIVDLANGRVVGCEALARWVHDSFGEVEPSVFVPVAEECGLICTLGEFVLETAARELAQWRGNGGIDDAFYVSVNLSTKQFSFPGLPEQIIAVLDKNHLQGTNLRLEITESILVENDHHVIPILDRLRARGIRICMDDFGTGYSSLCYLHRFPVDVLKVDQSFIRQLTRQYKSRAIVRTIMALADSLDMETIAEGAESLEHLEALKSMGFCRAQGFLFHQAKDNEAMAELLAAG